MNDIGGRFATLATSERGAFAGAPMTDRHLWGLRSKAHLIPHGR